MPDSPHTADIVERLRQAVAEVERRVEIAMFVDTPSDIPVSQDDLRELLLCARATLKGSGQ